MLMKILIIGNFSFLEYGGAKTVANYIIDGYKRAGHEADVLSFPRTTGKISRIFSQFLDVYNPAALMFLKAEIKKRRPDAVHLHNIHKDLSAYSLKLLSKMKVPAIVTLHESWALCPGFNLENGKDGKIRCRPPMSRYEIRFPLRNWLIRKFLSCADYIFVPSEFSRRQLLSHSYSAEKVIKIYNGFDLNVFSPIKKPIVEKKEIKVLFVGRPTAKKGINWLKDAINDLNKEGLNILLDIVGGENSVSYDKLPDFYREADMLIQPSLVHETFGNSVAEGMGCGLPVIVSNMGAMPEILGNAGLVVNPGDRKSLKKAIFDLALDARKRDELGKTGRERTEKMFDKNKMCGEYLKYIEKISQKN